MRFNLIAVAMVAATSACAHQVEPGAAAAGVGGGDSTGVGGGSATAVTGTGGTSTGTGGASTGTGGTGMGGAGGTEPDRCFDPTTVVDVRLHPQIMGYTTEGGTMDTPLLAIEFTVCHPNLNFFLTTQALRALVDCDTMGPFQAGVAMAPGCGEPVSASANGLIDTLALYQGGTKVSDFESIGVDTVLFNNLYVSLPNGTTVVLLVRGNVNVSAPYGVEWDRIKFAIDSVGILDENGQIVPTQFIYVSGSNGGLADSGIFITIVPAP